MDESEAKIPSARPPARIEFGLPGGSDAQHNAPSVLDEAREEHRKRAERFGVRYVDPARARPDMRLEARRERAAKPGFVTGFDLYSAEEEAKKRARAAKYGVLPPGAPPPTGQHEGNDGDNDGGFRAPPPRPADGVELDPDDDPAELARRRARAERFGVPLAPPRPPQQRVGASRVCIQFHGGAHGGNAGGGLMDVDALEAPAAAPAGSAPRPQGIYLYGVDLLSTGDCMSYFREYGPSLVEWINDSACVVLFADGSSAARAARGTGRALPPEEDAAAAGGGVGEGQQLTEGQQQVEGRDVLAEGAAEAMDAGAEAATTGEEAAPSSSAPVLWYRGRDYVKGGTAVRLLYRAATQADKRDLAAPKPPSRHLWKIVGGAGSKRGRDDRGGGGNEGGGGGGPGERRQPYPPRQGGGGGPQQPNGRRRRRMDGSYEEIDMADADDGGGGGEDGGEGGGPGGDGSEGAAGERRGRRVVRARRQGREGQEAGPPPQRQQRQPQRGQQQQQQQEQGQQGGEGAAPQRRGRGRMLAQQRRRGGGGGGGGFLEIRN